MAPVTILIVIGAFAGAMACLLWWIPKLNLSSAAGNALILTPAFLGLVLLLLSVAHVQWSRTQLLAFGVALIVAGVAAASRVRERWHVETASAAAALLALSAAVLYLRYVFVTPLQFWDYVAIWGLKARHFVAAGGIDTSWLRIRDPLVVPHPDYPPLVPAMIAAGATLSGHWNDQATRFLYVLFGAGLLLILAGDLIDEGVDHPILLSVIFVGVCLSPWTGLADGPFKAFLSSGVLMSRRGLRSGDHRVLSLAAGLLVCAALTKNEGVALTLSVGLAALLAGAPWGRIARLWPSGAAILLWSAYKNALGLSNDLFVPGLFERVRRNLPFLLKGARTAAAVTPSSLLIIAAVLACVAIPQIIRQERFVIMTIVIQTGLYWAAYVITPYNLIDHVANSWSRLAEHFIPLVAWITALAIGGLAKSPTSTPAVSRASLAQNDVKA